MYTYMYRYRYIHMYISLYIIYIYTHIYIYICIYIYTHTYAYTPIYPFYYSRHIDNPSLKLHTLHFIALDLQFPSFSLLLGRFRVCNSSNSKPQINSNAITMPSFRIRVASYDPSCWPSWSNFCTQVITSDIMSRN